MGHIAFKFVKWDVPELATLKDSKVYRLRECINNGGKLTRADKNWITAQVRECSYFSKGIALGGILFRFLGCSQAIFCQAVRQRRRILRNRQNLLAYHALWPYSRYC